MNLSFHQSIGRLDYLRLSHRRWPMSWAERVGGWRPSWWLHWAALPVAAFKAFRPSARFPIEQDLAFDDGGFGVAMDGRSRQLRWRDVSSMTELGNIVVLRASGLELPVFLGKLPPEQARQLALLLRRELGDRTQPIPD